MTWLAIIMGLGIQSALYLYASSSITNKDLSGLKALLFLWGLLNATITGGVTYAIGLNPTAINSYAPVGLGIFSVNLLLTVVIIYFYALFLIQRALKNGEEKDE